MLIFPCSSFWNVGASFGNWRCASDEFCSRSSFHGPKWLASSNLWWQFEPRRAWTTTSSTSRSSRGTIQSKKYQNGKEKGYIRSTIAGTQQSEHYEMDCRLIRKESPVTLKQSAINNIRCCITMYYYQVSWFWKRVWWCRPSLANHLAGCLVPIERFWPKVTHQRKFRETP